MKKIGFIMALLIIFGVVGCDKKLEPTNPENTAVLMKMAVDNQDYKQFNELFSEGRKGSVKEEEFEKFRKISTSGADYKRYELVTFGKGEMLLIRLSPVEKDGKITIDDVIIVPNEMKKLFDDWNKLSKKQ